MKHCAKTKRSHQQQKNRKRFKTCSIHQKILVKQSESKQKCKHLKWFFIFFLSCNILCNNSYGMKNKTSISLNDLVQVLLIKWIGAWNSSCFSDLPFNISLHVSVYQWKHPTLYKVHSGKIMIINLKSSGVISRFKWAAWVIKWFSWCSCVSLTISLKKY